MTRRGGRSRPLPSDPKPAAPARDRAPAGASLLDRFAERYGAWLLSGAIVLYVAIVGAHVWFKVRYYLYSDIDCAIFVQAVNGFTVGATLTSGTSITGSAAAIKGTGFTTLTMANVSSSGNTGGGSITGTDGTVNVTPAGGIRQPR